MNNIRNTITVFFATLIFSNASFAQVDSLEFEHFYSTIMQGLDKGEYKALILSIDSYRSQHFSDLDCRQRGMLSEREGIAHYRLYHDRDALRLWKDSTMVFWKDCPNITKKQRAKLFYNAGMICNYLNFNRDAASYIRTSIDLFAKIKDKDEERFAERQLELAGFYTKLGDTYNAELLFSQVHGKLEQIGTDKIRVQYYDELVFHHARLNENQEVIKYGNKSIEIQLNNEEKSKNRLVTDYLNVAFSNYLIGDYTSALAYYEKIIELHNKYQFDYKKEELLNNLPLTLAKLDRSEEAISIYNEIISNDNQKEHSDFKQRAYASENLADIYKRLGEHDKAEDLYRQCCSYYMPGESAIESYKNADIQTIIYPQKMISTISNRAHNKILQYISTQNSELLDEAELLYNFIDDIYNAERNMSSQFEQKALLSDQIKGYFNNAVEAYHSLFLQTNNPKYLEKAYDYAVANKSVIMKETSRTYKIISEQNADSLKIKEEKLLKSINRTYQSIQNADSNSNIDSLYAALISHRNNKEIFFADINSQLVAKANLLEDQAPLSAGELQKSLKNDELLIDYYFTDQFLYIFGLSNSNFKSVSIPNDYELQNKINKLRKSVSQDSEFDLNLASNLYNLLLGDVLLANNSAFNHIYIIPDEALLKIPFEALYNDGNFLIKKASISYLNSNLDLRLGNGAVKASDYIGFGSQYSKDLNKHFNQIIADNYLPLSQLNHAESEVIKSGKFWNGRTLLNKNATKQNFIDNIHNGNIVHIALHGLLDDRHPQHSAIAFDDRSSDILLNSNEIYSLNMTNQLVILSACSSGEGEIYKSEGTQSLAKSFLIAGSPSVLSSLWAVYDEPTSEIITSFNKHLSEGLAKHKALQMAKIDYLDNAFATKRAPKYWANLTLTGNIEPIKSATLKSSKTLLYGIIIVAIFFFLYRYWK